MAIRCGKCNEELLGAVNRCWKCGTKVVLANDDPLLPPIRRPCIDGTLYSNSPDNDVVVAVLSDSPSISVTSSNQQPVRKGSPFRSRSDSAAVRWLIAVFAWVGPKLGRTQFASAIISIALGIASLAFIWFPWPGLTLSFTGMLIGFWGLRSHSPGVAIVGLMLSCGAFSMTGFKAALTYFGSW